jgi:hypothetical protein
MTPTPHSLPCASREHRKIERSGRRRGPTARNGIHETEQFDQRDTRVDLRSARSRPSGARGHPARGGHERAAGLLSLPPPRRGHLDGGARPAS